MSDANEREPCPAAERLADLLADHVSPSERSRLEEHVGRCTVCQDRLLALAGDVRTLETSTTESLTERPPESLLERLKWYAHELADAPVEIEPPPEIPGVEILDEIGRGGTAIIYRARQRSLNRIVAAKCISKRHLTAESLARNRRGVEALAGLTHPAIVQVFEVGETAGCVYGLLEFMEEGNLRSRLAGKAVPPTDAARILRAVADAVAFMHEHDIVHRDLKTSNILLSADGSPKVADFGIAKRWNAPDDLTRSGDILGTPAYMAPEQAAGGDVGVRSDIYSLGVILYELLIGRVPFRGATALDTLDQAVHLAPIPPTRIDRTIPRDLETICLKCLDKDPAGRFGSAAELRDDLDRFLKGEPIRARPTPPRERLAKWIRRRPDLAMSLLALAVVAVVGLIALLIEREHLRQALAEETRIRRDNQVEQTRVDEDLRRLRRELSESRLVQAALLLDAKRPADARAVLLGVDPTERGDEWRTLWRRVETTEKGV